MGLAEELFKSGERDKAKRIADMDRDRMQREAAEESENRQAVIDTEEYNKLHAELEKQIADNIANPKTDFARDNYDNYGITSPGTFAIESRLSNLEAERAMFLRQKDSVQTTKEYSEKINLISEELSKQGITQQFSAAAEPATANNSNLAKIAAAGVAIFLLFR